tara:strand:- start:2000 stop:2662 length:663 start_codon:yes stop_codon:yes gene_type:complete
VGQALLRPAGILEDEYGLHLLVLDALCIKHIGPEYIGWDTEALKAELSEDFGDIGVVTWERIQAARLLHANDSFWKEWEVFEKVTAAIMGEPPIFSYSQPPEAEEIAIAIATAAAVANHKYTDDVCGYMAAACLFDGLWYLDDHIEVAEAALTEHDKRKGISRAFAAVAGRLEEVSDYIKEPNSAIDVQVNHVISVRKALAEYNGQIEKQLLNLPKIMEQ